MAETQLQEGKYREAGKWFEKAWRAGNAFGALEAVYAYSKDSGKNSPKKALQLCDAIIADSNLRADPRHSDDYITATRLRAELIAQTGDEKSSLQVYKEASDGGDTIASRKCAEAYFHGRDGVKKDLAQALKYYQRAARDDHETDALYQCGRMYYFGDGCTKDYEKAFSYFERLAVRGDERGIFLTICMLYKGIGTPKDEARAVELSEQITSYYFDRQQRDWEAECQRHREVWNGLTLTTRYLESELYRLKKEQEENGLPL